ncbi:hypothetical protein N7539_003057 [Penicillium diatomitis]|uniref:Uncharacterized protein n=1 Tax=Penicillium diatomitis TaxID=2819901 RepID=A0A9W9XFU8_9EURO|nr:uncharacterized protein N7539_003057 [Penicillium diatomitis]KAJ5491490.1 hypothetical protein N7539_003057 [Penicillium diatomitis]
MAIGGVLLSVHYQWTTGYWILDTGYWILDTGLTWQAGTQTSNPTAINHGFLESSALQVATWSASPHLELQR